MANDMNRIRNFCIVTVLASRAPRARSFLLAMSFAIVNLFSAAAAACADLAPAL